MTVAAWLVHPGPAGFRVQCEGLAAALGLTPRTINVAPPSPYRWLAPYGPAAPNPEIRPPYPDIAIGSGRQSVPYMRRLRRAGTFTVFLQNPKVPTRTFDTVWVPKHDRLDGTNVVTTPTSPHDLTIAKLRAVSASFEEIFTSLPIPLIGVVVGGANGAFELGQAEIDRLATDLAALSESHGVGIALTPSRRTGQRNVERLASALRGLPAFVWDLDGPNPYHAILARADWLLVTCDSVNMIGEAAFTGAPVYMLRLPGGSPKFERFHRNLIATGRVRWFEGALDSWPVAPINATDDIADAVAAAYQAKTGKSLR